MSVSEVVLEEFTLLIVLYTPTYGPSHESDPSSESVCTLFRLCPNAISQPSTAVVVVVVVAAAVVPSSPLAAAGRDALGLSESHKRPCQRRLAGWLSGWPAGAAIERMWPSQLIITPAHFCLIVLAALGICHNWILVSGMEELNNQIAVCLYLFIY